MLDLTEIYRAFDADEPLSAGDPRFVDLTTVQGSGNICARLVQQVKNAGTAPSHHLLMGHTKCGKTTILNRTKHVLEEEGYVTVFFDIAEQASRAFEYTTLLLMLAGQVTEQLRTRNPKIAVAGTSVNQLLTFLQERELTLGGKTAGDVTGKAEAKVGWLTRFLGELGLGLELRGGFERSREITVKLEADTEGFLAAVAKLVRDAEQKVRGTGAKGLVVICDGCDKLNVSATDEQGKSYDLQRLLFVDHAPDLKSMPCHVIYTVPISSPFHCGDVWGAGPEIVPAIPVNDLPNLDQQRFADGRTLLKRVVEQRVAQVQGSLQQLFTMPEVLDHLVRVSGGHVSDLLLLVRDAVLEAQVDGANQVEQHHIDTAIARRAQEYTQLIESRFLPILVSLDEAKAAPALSEDYREVIFRRLVLEYLFSTERRVDLHPLVAASSAYRRYRNPNAP